MYDPPWADAYSFSYPPGWPGADLKTTKGGNLAYQNLRDTGYKAYDTRNVSASTAMTYAKSDAVWAFFGHGRPGAVMFYNGTKHSELVANGDMSSLDASIGKVALSDYTFSALHDLRLMVFAGCNTAKDGKIGSLDDGNLSRVAYIRKGIDSTLAFQKLIYWPAVDYWADAFFNRLRRTDDTINQAATNAEGMLIYSIGWTGGTESWWTIGGAKRIKPVGYGD